MRVPLRMMVLLPLMFPLLVGSGRAQTSSNMTACIKQVDVDAGATILACTAALQSEVLSETNRRSALNNRGIAYRGTGDYEHAIQDFNEAIQLNPNDDKVLNNLGAAYMMQGDNDHAIQNYDKAIQLNPDYFIAIKNRAAAYADKGDFERAMVDYDRALKLNPQHSGALQTRGILHFFSEDYQGAAKDEKDSLQVDPTDGYSAIWYYLAQTRSGHDARTDLMQIAAGLKLTNWPGPVIQVFLGNAKPDGLVSLAKASSTRYAAERECEADFYLGERALLSGDRAGAAKFFRAAAATGPSTNLEYRGALGELTRLQAKP
jgi:lipoprotein NlpI